MKRITRLLALQALVILHACGMYSDGDNKSMDYSSLEVNFTASFHGLSAPIEGAVAGIHAVCTRNEVENTLMGGLEIATFVPNGSETPYQLYKTADDQAVISDKGDHNFRFYALYPYDTALTDVESIPVTIPSTVTFGSQASMNSLFFATASKSSVIAPVALDFNRLDFTAKFMIPDNVIDFDGGTVLKKLEIRPKDQASMSQPLAWSGTYNLLTSEVTVDPATEKSTVTVDFGQSGYEMTPGNNAISVRLAPFTIPVGGIELVLTDLAGNSVSHTVWAMDYGTEIKAGEVRTASIQMDEGLDVVPCNSPVEWPVGYVSGVAMFTKSNQPLWPQKDFKTVQDYVTPHTWTSTQPQATITWNLAADHPKTSDMLIENNQFSQFNYSSPCIKGIWTGDFFEFKIPVTGFKAGTSVTVTIPAYNNGGPVFWNVEYLDGSVWKSNKSLKTSVGDQFEANCTWVIPFGNIRDTAWKGTVMTDTIVMSNMIRSGYLTIRMKCVDGSKVVSSATSCKTITAPSKGVNPFAFVHPTGACPSRKVEWTAPQN